MFGVMFPTPSVNHFSTFNLLVTVSRRGRRRGMRARDGELEQCLGNIALRTAVYI